MKLRLIRTACVVSVIPLLCSCAAALLPLAAGGVMAGSRNEEAVKTEPQSGIVSIDEVPQSLTLPTNSRPDRIAEPAASNIIVLNSTSLPAPSSTPQSGMVGRSRDFDALYAYASNQARQNSGDTSAQSAMLSAPGTLRPERVGCSNQPLAILLDIDPQDGLFNPETSAVTTPSLIRTLQALRALDISIFWLSGNTALKAGSIRKLLIESGLDSKRQDELLVMRRADDSKQTRRQEIAETHCLIAIAGDQRADFDHLYEYLRTPDAAIALEPMLGAGWFLTPLPFTEASSTIASPDTIEGPQ